MTIKEVVRTGRADQHFLDAWVASSDNYNLDAQKQHFNLVRDKLWAQVESGRRLVFETSTGELVIDSIPKLREWMMGAMDFEFRAQ